MKEYLLSLLCTSVVIALVGILTPNATASQLKLIASLFFICVLAAPIPRFLESIPDLMQELTGTTEKEDLEEDYREQTNAALENASKTYLAQTLTSLLEQRFAIPVGEVRCTILWDDADEVRPKKVTVILSGSAIWKNPNEIESAVRELLGCECVTAIE